jgi:hypothetical protein
VIKSELEGLQGTLEDARNRTPGTEDVKREGENVVERTKEGLVHAKDAALDSAKYLAGRFTAPISGDERTDRDKVLLYRSPPLKRSFLCC